MLAALTALRTPPTSADVRLDAQSETSPRRGEVAVPVVLASAAIAATVGPGDLVDVVAVPDDDVAAPEIVADAARVLRPATSGGFGSTSSAVVLLAVPAAEGLRLSAAVGRTLTLVIRTG